jgi:4-amino-4-deoxy-L-arabinose transferase-like glycosyltransferase
MDDVDAVQAQIARNMLQSGDWVTARLNGIAYLEKSPLGYWLMATSYRVFGIHDWAARLPLSIAAVALCWVTLKFGCGPQKLNPTGTAILTPKSLAVGIHDEGRRV